MISAKELNPHNYTLTPEQAANQVKLLVAINRIRTAYAKPMIVTSGVRSWDDQVAIYKKIGRQPPKGSSHLTGAACDISDRDGSLARFCLDNLPSLAEAGLYIEDPSTTAGWVHFQTAPPASGNRVFLPFIRKART